MNRNALVIGVIVALLAGFGLGAWTWQRNKAAADAAQAAAIARSASASKAHAEALERDGAARLGPAQASVTIVEFFDPACDTCAEFASTMKGFVDQNPGRVQLVSRYAPFHPGSEKMVAILEAAKRQDKYWQALEIMFTTQRSWADHENPQPDLVWGYLEQGGLDVARLRADMTDPTIAAAVAEDIKDAKALGITQTPEFFVNGKPLPTWGMRQLTELVYAELAANK